MKETNIKYNILDGYASMNFERVTQMLEKSYWVPGIKQSEVEKGALNSALVIGGFLENGFQISYARVISDKTRFAYILDVYVDEQYRHNGIGQAMIKYILSYKDLADVYQWYLITKDAHEVYAKAGFEPLGSSEKWMQIKKNRS